MVIYISRIQHVNKSDSLLIISETTGGLDVRICLTATAGRRDSGAADVCEKWTIALSDTRTVHAILPGQDAPIDGRTILSG